ncbi:MAG: aminotransferase class I/II-fold pyridoxal phosphate-dependent enzyme [Actinomycetota bacterium]|nr:aminotransferase class I/II-fold pyridoxal phosphate-dependent enzyme [Actinomycetota bacterium]MDH5224459.1 aminotransferase class I/II-fold pyridoxal phosphate-dependent enzyme [Actinomycetota bacterium]
MSRTRLRASTKASSFTESVIRDMTRLADRHGAINLGQGFPDFPAPSEVKDAAARAIAADHNQYPVTWGVPAFREAIAAAYARDYGLEIDPETEICVTCGSTEAMIASMLGVLDPGDHVVVFEPFYENYAPDSIIAGAVTRHISLSPPDWTFDEADLRAAFEPRTRAVVINTPNNPTGKVFSRAELTVIAALCIEHDAIAITDEIYEHITYDGARHVPIATLPGMSDRTITISALSKTYSVTGWRVGWAIASRRLMTGIRPVHDFLTVAAPAPFQVAGITAMQLPGTYYERMRADYAERRDVMLRVLADCGFEVGSAPEGAYYVMADCSHLGLGDDVATARHLVEHAGVATVPGSSFVSVAAEGAHLLRFAFCKRVETLVAAGERLRRLI